jgi:hypothetical protein
MSSTQYVQNNITPRGVKRIREAKNDRLASIQSQLVYAQKKYQEVLLKVSTVPTEMLTAKDEEEVWAWGMFSETVLPMLLFIDDA